MGLLGVSKALSLSFNGVEFPWILPILYSFKAELGSPYIKEKPIVK